MSHVRTVTGTIHKPDGTPWPDFAIGFDVPKTAATTHATLPGTSVGASTTAHTIVTQTNASGEFSVDLEVDVTIRVTMLGALVTAGTSTRYPGESQFVIVVPDGDTPISLETIRAAEITPPDDPTLPNLVAQVASDLSDHEGDTDNPHEVTAAQVDTYTTSEIDNLINDHRPEWGNIDGDLADQTDLASALGDKADAGDLTAHTSDTANPHGVTAAQTGTYTSGEIDNALSGKADTGDVPTELTDLDTSVTGAELDALKQAADQHGDIVTHDAAEFATAAQGAKADTALQPAALDPYETTAQLNSRDTANRDRANHTGTQAISTVSGLQTALDDKTPAILTSKGDLYGHDGTDPARVSVGQGGQVLVADSGQDAGVGWERRAYPLPDNGGYAMSSMLLGMRQIGFQTHTLAQDTLTVVPIEVPRRSRFTHCQIHIDEATAAGELRLGLFRGADGLNQFTHIADIAVVGTTSTGLKIITPLSIWCDPGVYWIGMLASEETKVRAITPSRGIEHSPSAAWAQGNRRKGSVPFGAFDPIYSGFGNQSDPYTPQVGLYPIGGS